MESYRGMQLNQLQSQYIVQNNFIENRAMKDKSMKDKPKIWGMMGSAVVSYFLSFLLDRLFFINLREVKFRSKVLYIDRPGGGWDLLMYYLIMALIMALLFYIFLRWFQKHHDTLKKIVIASLGGLILIGFISLFLIQLIPIAGVDNVTEISGRVDELKTYSYLFVRSIGSNQCWLQNPVPLQPDNSGKWITEAYFGGESGSKYELIVISSKTDLDQFSNVGGYLCNKIPVHLKRFVRIVKLK